MTLESVIEDLSDERISPGSLSQIHIWLTVELSKCYTQMERLTMVKPARWMAIRNQPECGSDKQADLVWDQTPDGQSEIACKWRMKALEKLRLGVRTRLNVMADEARGIC